MSEPRIESYRMPAASLGPKSPLPPLRRPADRSRQLQIHESIPAEGRRYIGYGRPAGPLPYRMQNGFDRNRKPQDFQAAVLENEFLRATFLPEIGGRLWSLVHLPTGRELLHRNPVLQPGNLAVRSAWVSGGVEWNCSVPGHSPHTLSPLFAAIVDDGQGRRTLRMYEWDRVRGSAWQIDAYLPDGSEFLFVRVRIVNPHDHEIPMYWWSNIAVDERSDVRVIVPAVEAYTHAYAGGIRAVPVPVHEGVDTSYSTRLQNAQDFFYDVLGGHRPFIAALDHAGTGLVQTSTPRLKGRKLFLWGQGNGGGRWQEFLSVSGSRYIEIQCGLARTQMECIPMRARTQWSWLEAYGLMQADPAVVHGRDWPAAFGAVEGRLNEMLPTSFLEAELDRTADLVDTPPNNFILRGSGWGALERRRRLAAGPKDFLPPGMAFDDASLGEDQRPWLALLDTGELPCRPPTQTPGPFMVQQEWKELLQNAVARGRGDHWLSWLHLGVMHYEAGDVAAAQQAWRRSLQLEPSAWALRNLAVAELHRGGKDQAAHLYLQAWRTLPEVTDLTIECCRTLVEADRAGDALGLIDSLPAGMRSLGRIRLYEALAALALDQLDRVESILQDLVVPDMREGEVSLSEVWFAMWQKRIAARENVPIDDALRQRVARQYPPPSHLDFRMRT